MTTDPCLEARILVLEDDITRLKNIVSQQRTDIVTLANAVRKLANQGCDLHHHANYVNAMATGVLVSEYPRL
jgi:hypothetical protein